MKALLLGFAVLVGCASSAAGARSGTLLTLRAIHDLTNAEASKRPAVAFEATVTYRRDGESTLFVQDAGVAIYVWADQSMKMASGDRVLIKGKAQESFRPIVIADSVSVVGHGPLPRPVPADFEDLIRARFDCMRVSVRAPVQSADQVISAERITSHLQLRADGGLIDVFIDGNDKSLLTGLLDAEVEVTGVASGKFDGKMQHIGVQLALPSFAFLKGSETPRRQPLVLAVHFNGRDSK